MIWKIDLGSAVLYGICDGRSNRDPLEYLIGSTAEELAEYPQFLNADGTMPNSFSCFLFDTGSSRIMVDTAFGYNGPAGTGDMPVALDTLGVSPADIDHVVFTHMHPDHILGSLDAERAPLFTNATHWTLQREVEHWRRGTDDRSRSIAAVADALDGAGLLNPVEEPGDLLPGVTTIPTYGHSPGHTSVRLSSGDDSLIITGDVTFSPMHIDHPEWNFVFDVDKPLAARTRAEFFDMLAETASPYVAGHYAQPGYGRVVVTAGGRRYEALPVIDVA
jgi:glyoxylase-like metal-dependent hydrolase (beta-lactamase superfamily II)